MRFAYGATSDVGQVRSLNEDSYYAADDELFAVADGMGGHRAGEVASAKALEVLRAAFGRADIYQLIAAVQSANRAVFDSSQSDPELSGMGTTLCALGKVVLDGEPYLGVVNVGDSRVYRYSNGELQQLSLDHSFVEALVRDGRLTRAQADVHPQRNVLTRALGIEPDVVIDAWRVVAIEGDRYLLCSDGLFNEINDSELAEVLGEVADPNEAASELVQRAVAAGGRDNVTCVVVDVHIDDDPDAQRVAGEATEVITRYFDPTDDLAAFDDEQISAAAVVPPAEPAPAPAPSGPAEPARREPRSSGWRTLLFVAGVVATLGVAFIAIGWIARDSYSVGFKDDRVVVFQGRSLLWFKRTVHDTERDLSLADVRDRAPTQYDEIRRGRKFTGYADAVDYVSTVRDSLRAPVTTTTTSTTSTTSTSQPAESTTSTVASTAAPPPGASQPGQ